MNSPQNQPESVVQHQQDVNAADIIAEPLNVEEAEIDVVAVHGLGGGWQNTWSRGKTAWIRDSLPNDFPHARIFAYGHDVRDFSQKGLSFSDASYDVFQSYERQRKYEKQPVIFIAHSLGGIILQAFLQRCSPPLRASVKGILFFGTPNLGFQEKNCVEYAAAMYDIGYPIDKKYLLQLKSINEDFRNWLSTEKTGYAQKIVCFYERLPVTDNIIIVKEKSAVLPHCDATGLNANHFDMAKLSTEPKYSTNYQIVLQKMKSMYCLADDSIRMLLRHSLRPGLHGRLKNLPTMPDGCEELIVSTKGNPEAKDIGRLALISEDQGHFQKSEEKFQNAVELLIISPLCSPEIKELGQFALTLGDQSNTNRIEEIFKRTLDLLRNQKSFEPNDAVALFCLQKLASLMCQRGQYKYAEYCARCCLEARRLVSGIRSVPTLLTADNLAASLQHQGKHQDAYNLLRDALEGMELPFLENVSYTKLIDTLAKLALECEMDGLAESLSCDALRNSISLFGDQHPFTLNRMSDLAAIFARTDSLPSAEAMGRRALDGLEQALGTDHPDSLKAASRLADYIRLQKRFEDASLRLKQILKTQQMRIGDAHPDTLSTMRSLGAVYTLQGYWKDAEVLLDEALTVQQKFFGEEHSHTLWTVKALNVVKELQKEQDPTGYSGRSELNDLFGPKPRSISQNKRPDHFLINTPLWKPSETEIFKLAADGDKEILTGKLTEKFVDQKTLGRALREAAASSQETIVNLLLKYNAPINAQSGYYGTALHAASFAGNEAIVKLLLTKNADVNQECGIFGNAIRAALLGEHTAIILDILLDSTDRRKISRPVLNSSLHLALRISEVKIISQLLEVGAEINAEDSLFGNPLQQATFFGQEDVMKMLLELKVDIQTTAGIFTRPLQVAIETQNKSAIWELLKAGASVHDPYSKHFNILLDKRSTNDEQELVKILYDRSVDSSQFKPPSPVSTFDPLQASPQSNSTFLRWTGLHVQDVKSSQSLSYSSTVSPKDPKVQRVSTIMRILTFNTGSNEDHFPSQLSLKNKSRMRTEQVPHPIKNKVEQILRPLKKRFSNAS